jgi:5-methyltetrahydrofolate--homocysteine methyltransferase
MSSFEQVKNSLQSGTQLWNGSLWDPAWSNETQIAGCGEMLSLERPDIIRVGHRALLEAGADAISTNTFGATASAMKEYNAHELVSKVNFESARLARVVRDEFASTGGQKWVIGSIGPTFNALSVAPGVQSLKGLEQEYHEQAKALREGGADLLHIERCQDLLNLRAAVLAIKRLESESKEHIPLMVTLEALLESVAIFGADTVESLLQIVKEFRLWFLGSYFAEAWLYLNGWRPGGNRHI